MVDPQPYEVEDFVSSLLRKKWTCMFFMSGENHNWMEAAMETDLGSLDEVDLSDIGIVVMFDKLSTGEAELYYLEWDILTESNTRVMKEGYPAARNMGASETLLDLLNYATENCDADNYMLTICGHGASFLGVAHDHNPRDRLIIPEISESLERAELNLELIILDACSMASVEVGLQIKDNVHYMAASEDNESSTHWVSNIMSELVSDPEIGAMDMSMRVVEVYEQTHRSEQDYTFSAINLSKLDEVLASMDRLSEIYDLVEPIDPLSFEYYDQLVDILIEARRDVREYFHGNMVDIYDFADTFENLLRESDIDSVLIRDHAFGILTSIKEAIEYPILDMESLGTVMMSRSGSRRRRSHGLDIYFPRNADWLTDAYALERNPVRQAAPHWTELIISCARNEHWALFLPGT